MKTHHNSQKNILKVSKIKVFKVKKALLLLLLLIFSEITFAQYQFKKASWDARPELNNLGLPVRDFNPKGTRGTTCTFFALTFLVEYNSAKEFKIKNLDLSEEFLIHATNRATGHLADNANFPQALLGYETYGMIGEGEMPYADKYDSGTLQGNDSQTLTLLDEGKNSKFRYLDGDYTVSANAKNSNPGLTDEQLNKLKEQLDNGNPVGIGYAGNETAGKFTLADIGNGKHAFDEVTLNTVGEYAHSVALVGYKVDEKINGGGYVIFRNCGGESWGDKGYGYMTFNFLKKFTYDFLYLNKMPAPTTAKANIRNQVDARYQPRRDYLIGVANQIKNVNKPFVSKKGMQNQSDALKQGAKKQ